MHGRKWVRQAVRADPMQIASALNGPAIALSSSACMTSRRRGTYKSHNPALAEFREMERPSNVTYVT